VLLRGFGRIHIFPGDDVGGRNKLYEFLGETADARLRRRAPNHGTVASIRRTHLSSLIVSGLVDNGHVESPIARVLPDCDWAARSAAWAVIFSPALSRR